jgi:hypothetical protein
LTRRERRLSERTRVVIAQYNATSAERQGVDANPVGVKECVGRDIKCVRMVLQRLKGGHDILRSPDFERGDFEADRAGGRLSRARLKYGIGKADIDHDRQPAKNWDNLAQEFESLANSIGELHRQAGNVAAWSR